MQAMQNGTLYARLQGLLEEESNVLEWHELPALAYLPMYGYGVKAQQADSLYEAHFALAKERAFVQSAGRALAQKCAVQYGDDEWTASMEHAERASGIGTNLEEAIWDGALQLMEKATMARYSTVPQQAVRLVDWEQEQQLQQAAADFARIGGTIEIRGLDLESAFPLLFASATLPAKPYRLDALAIGKGLSDTVVKVVERLLQKFYLFLMLEDTGHPMDDQLWWQEAVREQQPESPAPIESSEDRQVYKAAPTNMTHDLEPLRQWMRAQGLKLFALDITPQELRENGIVVVETACTGGAKRLEERGCLWTVPHRAPLSDAVLVMPTGRKETELSRMYHQNSKIREIFSIDDYIFPVDKISGRMQQVFSRSVKDYRFARVQYALPDVRSRRTRTIEDIILQRRSANRFVDKPITLEQLAHLLYYSYGLTGQISDKSTGTVFPTRATPSGGGLYPVNLYFLAQHVEGVVPGVYYYNPQLHTIFLVQERVDFAGVFQQLGGSPKKFRQAAVMFLLTAHFPRHQWKYRERGYRVMHLDSGHLGQSIVMAASGLGLGVRPFMGFVDDYFNELIGVDGFDEAVLYLVLVGQVKESEA